MPENHKTAKLNSESKQQSANLFKRKKRFRVLGLNLNVDGAVKGFFGGNAYLAILFLLFICLFLWKSAIGFVPRYKMELTEARQSGIEASNIIADELKGHQAIYNILSSGFVEEKRQKFGQQEAVIYVYEELEALIDDQLEDEVDAYLELDDSNAKQLAASELKLTIDKACRALPSDELLTPVQKRIENIESISEEVLSQAIALAQSYALADYTTPDEIDQISSTINDQMGDYGKALDDCKKSATELTQLHNTLEKQALETFKSLQHQRDIKQSILTLTNGLEKHINSDGPAEQTVLRKEQISKLESSLSSVDVDSRITLVYQQIDKHPPATASMVEGLRKSIEDIPYASLTNSSAKESVDKVRKLLPEFSEIIDDGSVELNEWRHDKPFTTIDSLKAFFFGTSWNTGSSRQSLFGLVPLFTGSLLISAVAMFFAIPLAVGAAIYVNQFARKREANFLKPMIEFIQAIPSVVLGLFGVLVVAGLLKDLSQIAWLQWVPGFPIADRLNVLLAGVLLAFMAAPTIFTLAEDALNNVPKAHSEASLAMGANKLQTTLKVIVPASMSGIIAAVMLGFGRVIGETMVVLLVAGNMAKMPDFSAGFDVIGQSVHTMTGIIASENGEAAPGTILWEGLFMVGLVLFLISLTINSICQRILNRNKA